MAVDRDNGREIAHFEFPDRLGTPEPFEADAENTLDAPGVDLRGAAEALLQAAVASGSQVRKQLPSADAAPGRRERGMV